MFVKANDQAAGALKDSSGNASADFAALFAAAAASEPGKASRSGVAALGIAFLMAMGSSALADTISFKADLWGGGEAPPNDTRGIGHLEATLDTSTNTLTWTCTYSGLTGAPFAAHFHGPVSYSGTTSEENAPIQVGTPGNLTSPFKGKATVDATQAQDLKMGRWYFNVHTPSFPGGEVRGPIVQK
jgi:hypothetical protein